MHTRLSAFGLLQAVQLALGCLSFDFVGTCLDESAEDLGTIQARPCLPPAEKLSLERLQPALSFYVHNCAGLPCLYECCRWL